MLFWGVEVKPGKFFIHPSSDRRRLHLSQATLGMGTATDRCVLQCNIGDKAPVFLCALQPNFALSSALNLDFQESAPVVFSVLGPLSIHLSGYYASSAECHNDPEDNTESYGEDIADTESKGSANSSDEDYDYEDSFINDSDPGMIPSSPEGPAVEKTSNRRKVKIVKGGRRRLKKYESSDAEDNSHPQQKQLANDLNDLAPSDNTSEEDKCGIKMEARKVGDGITEPEQNVIVAVDIEPKSSILSSAKVASPNDGKPKHKKGKVRKEKSFETQGGDDFFFGMVLKQLQSDTKPPKAGLTVIDKEHKRADNSEHTPHQQEIETNNLEQVSMPHIDNQDHANSESLKKRKKRKRKHSGEENNVEAEGPIAEGENLKNLDVTDGGNQIEANDGKCDNNADQSVNDNTGKKKKKKRRKEKVETIVMRNEDDE